MTPAGTSLYPRYTLAKGSVCNYRQLNTGVGAMCGWCLAYCTGVVLNTVRKSDTPDNKEKKQADAGSRRFRRHFLCGAFLCNFSSPEHEGLSTHTCPTGMLSRTFHISPRFSPMTFDSHANSVLLRAHLCTAELLLAHLCTAVLIGSMRRTLCSKLFMMRA